jgi:hypothetical protein
MWKAVAAVGLLFWLYYLIQILLGWRHREATHKVIRLLTIGAGTWCCIHTFFLSVNRGTPELTRTS